MSVDGATSAEAETPEGSTRVRSERPSDLDSPIGRPERRRALLFGSPREVLARISAGDPLALRERVAAFLLAHHLLMDSERLHLRACAHVARRALRLRAADSVDPFLDARVSDAAAELLREDREGLRNDRPRVGALEQLAGPAGLDAGAVRAACTRFNDSGAEDRRAAFALFVEGADVDSVARREGASVSVVARRARRALDAAIEAVSARSPSPRAPAP